MITTRELADSFTPSDEEIEWARDKTSTDPHLLALAVWLKCYRRLGYFPKLDEVRRSSSSIRARRWGCPQAWWPRWTRTRTAKRHREFIRKRLGVKYDSVQARISPRRRSGQRRRPRTTRPT